MMAEEQRALLARAVDALERLGFMSGSNGRVGGPGGGRVAPRSPATSSGSFPTGSAGRGHARKVRLGIPEDRRARLTVEDRRDGATRLGEFRPVGRRSGGEFGSAPWNRPLKRYCHRAIGLPSKPIWTGTSRWRKADYRSLPEQVPTGG